MDFSAVENKIKEKFIEGPGELPISNRKGVFLGGIVPESSLSCASWLFKELGERKLCDTYIIFIKDESVKGIVIGDENINTEFGVVRVDLELVRKLLEINNLTKDNSVFQGKLNTLILYLQFVSKQYLNSIKYVPIVMNSWNEDFLEYFLDVQNIGFLVVTDLTKFEEKNPNILKSLARRLEEIDLTIIEKITALDREGFYSFVKNRKFIQMYAVMFLIEIAKWKKRKPRLLNYGHQTDLDSNSQIVLGSSSLLF